MARPTNTHGRSGIWESPAFVRALAAEQRRIGAKLRELREARNWTLERAAERARLHPVSLSRIESGKANVTVGTLLALVRAYRVELAELFARP